MTAPPSPAALSSWLLLNSYPVHFFHSLNEFTTHGSGESSKSTLQDLSGSREGAERGAAFASSGAAGFPPLSHDWLKLWEPWVKEMLGMGSSNAILLLFSHLLPLWFVCVLEDTQGFQGRDDVLIETQEKDSEPQSFEGTIWSLTFLKTNPGLVMWLSGRVCA